VLAAGAAAGYFLVKGGKGGHEQAAGDGRGVSNETPDFAFEVLKSNVIPTADGTHVSREQGRETAASVAATLDDFYKSAFLDPANWREGTYDSTWAFFDKQALTDAKADADTLTLGAGGADYASVMPKPSTTTVKILVDEKGKARTAAAQVTFGALVTDGSGNLTTVASMGQYFLNPDGNGWTIYAFRVQRSDQEGDHDVGSPPPSPKKPKETPSSGATP